MPARVLTALGWDHERCMTPMRAAARAWQELHGLEIRWDARTLRAFGDDPLEELAVRYDLLVIDHPFVGTAHETGCLTPLDKLLPAQRLAELAADSIGASHSSYAYAGHQWALAADAACQVAAVRDDLLEGHPVPKTWDDVLALARTLPGRVAVPLVPADAISSLLTLCANAGSPAPDSRERFVQPDAARRAIELLRELVATGHPRSLELDPPTLFELMAESDEVVYSPLGYGYTNYARPGAYAHLCRFLDIPSADLGPIGSVLGGAGIAVSAASAAPEQAAAFAAWVCDPQIQRGLVFENGGQPGSRTAWLDPELDRATAGFFSGTSATIEAASVRPRDPWWPPFQLAAGGLLNRALSQRTPPVDETVEGLEQLYRQAVWQ